MSITREKLREMILNNEDVTNVDVSEITDMSWLFADAIAFNQDISGWNVSNVTNMAGMFCNAETFNQDISNWDVSNVLNMRSMFENAYAFNHDITRWDITKVYDIDSIFLYARSLSTEIKYKFRDKFKNTRNVLSILRKYLSDNGYDGLRHETCYCTINNLLACTDCIFDLCTPGHLVYDDEKDAFVIS